VRILVTGGAGFIGANLSKRLVDDGHSVAVLDNLSTGFAANLLGVDVDFHKGSILDPRALAAAVEGADSVVHLAAIPSVPRSVAAPEPSHEANATGTLRVLQAARGEGAHVTVASSSSVYGANPELPKRESMVCRPRSPYAVSKLATESYAVSWQMTYGLPTIAFRFFNVYGPLQAAGHAYAAVIPAFLDAALHGRPVTVHGDGLQTRDFTFIDSVTELLGRAATQHVTSDTPVNLAFGSRRSLLDVIEEMGDVLGHPVRREHVAARVGDVRDSQADNSRLLGLFPGAKPTDFSVGLRRTADWMRTTLD
jgi:UDP-glucose 4-epimerase